MTRIALTPRQQETRDHFRHLGMDLVEYSRAWIEACDRPIYLFGAGEGAWKATELLKGLPIAGIMDNNAALWGKTRFGLPIGPPVPAKEAVPRTLMVMAVDREPARSQIITQCRELGYETVDWFDSLIRSDPRRYQTDLENKPEVLAGLELWEDQESRDVYEALIRFQSSFDTGALPPPAPSNEYFPDFIAPEHYQVFGDAGAHDGDTLRQFRDFTKNNYLHYYAFEPIPGNLAALKCEVGNDARVAVFPAALSDHSGSIGMNIRALGSFVSPAGDIEVQAARLDDLLDGVPLSCLKMDIEGSEPEALLGGEKTIRRERPVLIICVYHRLEHLWTLPTWIAELDLGYRLRLRHYSFRDNDTVCYALPPEAAP